MHTYYILQNNPEQKKKQVREGIANILYRCTGYQHIVEAVLDGAERMRTGGLAEGKPSVPAPPFRTD